jgi:hypothetical protein
MEEPSGCTLTYDSTYSGYKDETCMKFDLMGHPSGERKLTHAGVRKAKNMKPNIGIISDVNLSKSLLGTR